MSDTSSALQSAYKTLLLKNYISLVGCTIVGYDCILTFPKEIHYVWCRRWTWVSVVFVLVRYPGLCWTLLHMLIGSAFIPGPLKVSKVLFLVSFWTFPVFICATELVLILRVYALWNRSRTILSILLFFFILQVIVSVVLPAIYNSSPVYFIPTTVQVLNSTICSGSFIPSVPALLGVYSTIPRFLISAMLLILAAFRALKQLADMYKATKQWQPNRYMNQLTRDGVFYFVINIIYIFFAVPISTDNPYVSDVLGTVCSLLLCCLTPRFIISVRELYDRELRSFAQGIDTGFGVLSQASSGENGLISTISFAGAPREESWTGQGDEDERGVIRLEEADDIVIE